MANFDLTSNGWTDLIFEGRNKGYGAYKLRKNTPTRNLKSILVIAALAILMMVFTWIKTAYDRYQAAHHPVEQVTELSALDQPKKKAEVKRKQVQVEEKKEVVKEVKSSIKFTAPVIKKDNLVKPEEMMKTQDQLMQTNTAIGALDVKGNSDKGEIMKVTERVADEPVASLDVSIQAQIMALFRHLRQGHDFTFLFIAHDLAMVRYLCDRVGVMRHGRLVELAPTEELFARPLHAYTRALLSAMPVPDPLFEQRKEILPCPADESDGAWREVHPGHWLRG